MLLLALLLVLLCDLTAVDLGGEEITACLMLSRVIGLAGVAMLVDSALIRRGSIACKVSKIMRVLCRSRECRCRVLLRPIVTIQNDTSLLIRAFGRRMVGSLDTIVVFRDLTTLRFVTLRSFRLVLLFRTAQLLRVFQYLRVGDPSNRQC